MNNSIIKLLDFNNEKKRMIYFLFGCIGLRSYMAYISYAYGNNIILPLDFGNIGILKITINKLLSIFTLIAGIGFLYLYLNGLRRVAPEAGGKVWWNKIRNIHGYIYLLFTFSVWAGNGMFNLVKEPWKLLATDVIVGLAFYLHHHIVNYLR